MCEPRVPQIVEFKKAGKKNDGWQYKFKEGNRTIILIPHRGSDLQPYDGHTRFAIRLMRKHHVSHNHKRQTWLVELLAQA